MERISCTTCIHRVLPNNRCDATIDRRECLINPGNKIPEWRTVAEFKHWPKDNPHFHYTEWSLRPCACVYS